MPYLVRPFRTARWPGPEERKRDQEVDGHGGRCAVLRQVNLVIALVEMLGQNLARMNPDPPVPVSNKTIQAFDNSTATHSVVAFVSWNGTPRAH